MNTLPVPHPNSHEILRQQHILDNHATIDELINDAAAGIGMTPAVPEKSSRIWHEYKAHDYGENPVFRNGMGTKVRDVDALNVNNLQHVLTPDGGSVVAETTYNVVGSTYPLDISKSFRRFDSSGNLKDTVTIKEGWNGQYLEPRVTIWKNGEESRELSGDEELDVKTQIANAFGLNYDLAGSELPQRKDAKFDVSPEAKHLVDSMCAQLMTMGLKGDELRTALLKKLHPDTRPDQPELEEAFKYAGSLDYGFGPRIVNDVS